MTDAGTPTPPARRSVRSFLVRLVGTYLALTVALVIFERPVVSATAPLARAGLALFAPRLEVQALAVRDGRVEAQVTTARPRPGGAPGKRTLQMTVTTSARTLLVAPLLTVALLVAWGFASRRAWAVALAAAAALTAVALAHDLANGVVAGVAEALREPRGSTAFVRFALDNGGRQVLALAVAAAAAWIAHEATRPRVASASAPAPAASAGRRRRRALAAR